MDSDAGGWKESEKYFSPLFLGISRLPLETPAGAKSLDFLR
jgi:hypothetical protein